MNELDGLSGRPARSLDRLRRRRVIPAFVGALALAGGALASSASGSVATPPAEHVSTTGTDAGNCVSSPCKTLNYAISVASSGGTILVAAGTYNQTVNVSKPVKLLGAGAGKTILDGHGLDPSNSGYFGVVYFGAINGVATIQNFTITNPEPYTYTGGEPMAVVAYRDTNASDRVNILDDTITEGSADSTKATDFPIGIDTFLEAGTVAIEHDTISGFFQGALLEDNGPDTVTGSRIQQLITGTDNSTNPPTVYPPEGIFFLADEGGTYSGQFASFNTFSGYSGDGIDEAAGYQGGYVVPGCIANGSIVMGLKNNVFRLTGGHTGTGIFLQATGTGNTLSGTATGDSGYVTSPSNAIKVESISTAVVNPQPNCGAYAQSVPGAAAVDVVQNGEHLVVNAAHAAAARAAGAVHHTHALHVPRLAKL